MKNNSDYIYNITYGPKIKALRQQFHLTQAECAKQLGISALLFSKLENSVSDISISRLEQIASFFEVHISKLLDDNIVYDQSATEVIEQLEDELNMMNQEVLSLQRRLIFLFDLSKEKKKKQKDSPDRDLSVCDNLE